MRSLGFSEVGHMMKNYAENSDYEFKAFGCKLCVSASYRIGDGIVQASVSGGFL
jgi:hypothetical protein